LPRITSTLNKFNRGNLPLPHGFKDKFEIATKVEYILLLVILIIILELAGRRLKRID
jgi:hypothetical protein